MTSQPWFAPSAASSTKVKVYSSLDAELAALLKTSITLVNSPTVMADNRQVLKFASNIVFWQREESIGITSDEGNMDETPSSGSLLGIII